MEGLFFSKSNINPKLAIDISPSITIVFLPSLDSATAKFAEVVVFPTPPFPEATVIIMKSPNKTK